GVDLRFSRHSWHRTGGYLAQASGNADRRREYAELISETIARSHKQKSPRAISPLMELDFDFWLRPWRRFSVLSPSTVMCRRASTPSARKCPRAARLSAGSSPGTSVPNLVLPGDPSPLGE